VRVEWCLRSVAAIFDAFEALDALDAHDAFETFDALDAHDAFDAGDGIGRRRAGHRMSFSFRPRPRVIAPAGRRGRRG